MSIITLTTDFGERDHFVGAVKGTIYSELEDVKIVDISHSIAPFHLHEAAYIIQNAYRSFPEGTIHIIGVDSELNPENKHIARGGTLEVIGKTITEIKELTGMRPVVNNEDKQIVGQVIYIDNYGNVISNITKKLFETVGRGRNFMVNARGVNINAIYHRYSEAINFDKPADEREDDGRKLAIWNSAGYLELAVYKSNPSTVGSASSLFGLEFRDSVSINFT